jgi:hypothetical protein
LLKKIKISPKFNPRTLEQIKILKLPNNEPLCKDGIFAVRAQADGVQKDINFKRIP